MLIRIYILCLFLIFSIQGLADISPAEQSFLKEFLQVYHDHPKPQDFLEAIKNKLPPEVYTTMKAHLKDLGNQGLPKMKLEGDTLVLDSKGRLVFMKVVSIPNQLFSINNKSVDFSKAQNMDERWTLLRAALPQFSSNNRRGIPNLFMSEAYGEDGADLLRITGPLAGGVGIGVLVGAANIWNPYGWSIIIASYAMWNQGVCEGIEKQKEICLYEEHVLKEKITRNKINSDAFKNRVMPKCEDHGQTQEGRSEEKEVFNNLLSFVSGVEEKQRKITFCLGDRKKELLQCTKDFSLDAFYSCVYIPPDLTHYLPPWAKAIAAPQDLVSVDRTK